MKKILIAFSLIILIPVAFYAQYDANYKRDYYKAENLIEEGVFEDALVIYKDLLAIDPSNANLNFKVGYCYLNTVLDKKKAIPFLEKAITNISEDYNGDDPETKTAPLETYYYLGVAYHLDYKYDEAIEILENLRPRIPAEDKEFISKIDWEIQQCKNGIELMKYPVKMIVTNLGGGINTEYKEHSPVISADESVLIFTSRREGSTGGKLINGQYDEDIYIAHKTGENTWSEPESISPNINTPGHEASIGLSVDGTKLFIYKDDNGDGNIYYSELKGDSWSKPVKMGPTINTKFNETHASLSADGNELYFTSNRKGGYGGLDIYVVKKLPNNNWSLAQNLGPVINTDGDERCPYIHPDNMTLFFSSEKHFNMGGFDIFFSVKDENGKWQEPTNMGYPVNTTDDDVFYTPTPDGLRAYYASQQTGGIGATDIYMITLPGANAKALTVMSGIVTLSNGMQPEDVIIEVSDAETNEIVGLYTPNSKTGKYLFILTPGTTYNVRCEADGFEPYEEKLTVPLNSSYQKIQRPIILNPIVFTVDDGSDNNQNNTDNTDNNVNTTKTDTVTTDNNNQIADNNTNNNQNNDDQINDNTNDQTVNTDNTDNTDNQNPSSGQDIAIVSIVLFDFDMYTTEKYYDQMNKLAEYIKKNPDCLIELDGHTDAQGDDNYNFILARKRAEFVKDYLIKKGASEKNLAIKSFGETRLISKDLTPDSRKYNRRVEFNVIKQGTSKLNLKKIEIPEKYKLN